MTEKRKITIEFAPGCFDEFDGSQQELNELIQEIQKQADSGQLFENSVPLDIDDLHDCLVKIHDKKIQTRH